MLKYVTNDDCTPVFIKLATYQLESLLVHCRMRDCAGMIVVIWYDTEVSPGVTTSALQDLAKDQ